MTTAIAWYALGVGLLMLAWWGVDVAGGALHRPDRTTGEMGLHLAAELLTAAWLVVAGVALLTAGNSAAAFAAVGLGMLLYTVVQSPGYFLARHEYLPVALFAVLALASTVAIIGLVV